jgi:hypothetical protein
VILVTNFARLELLRSGPQEAGKLELTDAKSAAIASEMASGFDLVGEQIVSRYAG